MQKIENLRVQKAQLEAKVKDYQVQIDYLEKRISSLQEVDQILTSNTNTSRSNE